MSFLAEEEEAAATLQAALAFIDACDATDSGDSSGQPQAAVRAVSESLSASSESQKSVNRKRAPRKKRTRNPASSSTVMQRRKKAEIATLQDQVLELEVYLSQLKRPRGMPGVVHSAGEGGSGTRADSNAQASTVAIPLPMAASGADVWLERCGVEYRLRVQAERTNRKLKAIEANQEKVNQSLRRILQQQAGAHHDNASFKTPVGWEQPLSLFDNRAATMQKLEKRVRNLYLESHLVFQAEQLSQPSISNSVHLKNSDTHGKTMEFRLETPMECSMEDATELLWNLSRAERRPSRLPDSLEKNLMFTLTNGAEMVELSKLHFLRKFEEADRVVLVWSEVMMLSTTKIQLRGHGCTVISRAESYPEHTSVGRTLMQLYVECPCGDPPPAEDLAFAQINVLQFVSHKLRTYFQLQQDTLIEESAKIGTRPPLVSM